MGPYLLLSTMWGGITEVTTHKLRFLPPFFLSTFFLSSFLPSITLKQCQGRDPNFKAPPFKKLRVQRWRSLKQE